MMDKKFNITEKEINNWSKFGYLLRSNHLKNKIQGIIKSVDIIENIEARKRRSIFYYEEIYSKPRLCRIEKFIEDNKFINDIILGNLILGFVSKLLNKPVFLYKEKINIKYSGGSGYAAHQDATAYHKLKGHITCLIALTEMTVKNGCLYISELKNNNSLLPYDQNGCILGEEVKQLKWTPMVMSPGDCLFFNSFVPHKSDVNYTVKSRKAVYLTFNDSTEGDLRSQYYLDRSKILQVNKDRISTIGHFQGKNFKI